MKSSRASAWQNEKQAASKTKAAWIANGGRRRRTENNGISNNGKHAGISKNLGERWRRALVAGISGAGMCNNARTRASRLLVCALANVAFVLAPRARAYHQYRRIISITRVACCQRFCAWCRAGTQKRRRVARQGGGVRADLSMASIM